MISLNEAHNLPEILDNLEGWAQEVFLLDSFSADETVEIARSRGVNVTQREFDGFGSQWNAALNLPVTAPWTMKLDPDERLSEQLKKELEKAFFLTDASGLSIERRLWFMRRPLPISQTITRAWRTGRCRFTDVEVNEYPIVDGEVRHVFGYMEHLDSPNLHHWLSKQNMYSSAEAKRRSEGGDTAFPPRLWGSKMERWMWLKSNFDLIPFCFTLIFFYYFFYKGLWRAGWEGFVWSRLRADILRIQKYKLMEHIKINKSNNNE
jgi:glycosyltransferase involved in cell wall biosynthesis